MWKPARSRSLAFAAAAIAAFCAAAAPGLAVDETTRRLANSSDWSKRWDACEPLVKEGTPEATRLFVKLLRDPEVMVRDHAVNECWDLQGEEAVAVLAKSLTEGSPIARRCVAAGLAHTRLPSVFDPLATAARGDLDARVRAEALEGLRFFKDDPRSVAVCAEAVRDRDATVRAAAAHIASKLKGYAGRDVVLAAFADADEGVRATGLNRMWRNDARAHVPGAAADASWRVRVVAAQVAVFARTPEAIDALLRLLADPNDRVASTAARSLRQLSQKDFARDAELWAAWWKQNREAWKPPEGDYLDDPRTSTGPGTRAKFMGIEVEGEGTAFVIDASGSMSELATKGTTRAELVRNELEATLAALPDKHRVNVLYFSDGVRSLFERARPLSAGTRSAALKFMRDREPSGQTNLFGGVAQALEDDGIDTICLLSDGSPTAGDVASKTRVKLLVARANRLRRVAINVVGIAADDDSDREFLRELASENDGRCTLR